MSTAISTQYKVFIGMGLVSVVSLIYYLSVSSGEESGQESQPRLEKAEIHSLAKDFMEVQRLNDQLKKHAQDLKDLIVSSSNNGSLEKDAVADCSSKKLQEAEAIILRMEADYKNLILNSRKHVPNFKSNMTEPSNAYEKTRRRVEIGVREIWFYLRSQLDQIKDTTREKGTRNRIANLLEYGGEQQRTVMADIYNLSRVDGYSSWRVKESEELSNLIQQRFRFLQNPRNCSKARKIVCNFKNKCGFGSMAHHVAYCMIMAYGTGRTLVLDSKGWVYAKEGWETFFLPLSETCLDQQGETTGVWGPPNSLDEIARLQVVKIPMIEGMHNHLKPDLLPLAIPEDISQRLARLHGQPFAWWVGQILTFTQRLRPDVQKFIDDKAAALGFSHPIVGIQVRRTDKVGTEAGFHAIEEYMFHAEEFYSRLERMQEVPVRKIYLATDEPGLLAEAQKKYPNYVFVSDNEISRTADMSSRYTEESLKGIILDVHLLARSDFLVCTFTSNVCRLVYEMMQSLHADASTKFRSLDNDFYFHGQLPHNLTVLYGHKPRTKEEIELRPGDTVMVRQSVDGNRWDGNSVGTNMNIRPRKLGFYPTYKVEDRVETAKMPTYDGAENFHL